jgi:WD40 repeat protein
MNPPDPEKLSGLAEAPFHLGPPPRVPDYELVRRVGGGSYGDVWLARGVTGAWRAIKVVHRARFDRDKPYEREFNGILRFEPVSRAHESQVDILHVGRNDDLGCFYYVMELADDQRAGTQINPDTYAPKTLRSELQARGRMPLDEVIRLGVSLATALEHLHAAGLVHRDVKPSNIIYIAGVPKLADIGLVTDSASTRSYVGTEGYLPPEGPGAPTADVFGLGKVLYEAATGRDRLDFPELPEGFAEWPERDRLLELNEVLLRACAPEAENRYASATKLCADLERLQRGESLKRRNDTRRALLFAAKFAAAVVVPGVLSAAALWAWRNRPPAAPDAPVAPGAVMENRLPFRATLIQNAGRLRRDPADHESARRLLAALSTNAFLLPAAPTLVHRADVNAVVFSPDGVTLLSGTDSGGAVFWNWRESRMIGGESHASGAVVRLARFSADARFAADAAADGSVRLWNAAAPAAPIRNFRATAAVNHLEFSPDGRWLAFTSVRGRVWVVDTAAASPGRVLPGAEQSVAGLAFAPDSQRLLVIASRGALQSWGLPELQPVSPAADAGAGVYDADADADGRRVVAGTFEGAVKVFDGATLRALGAMAAHTRRVLRAHVSPDGALAATLAADRTARLTWLDGVRPWGGTWEPAGHAPRAVFTPDGLWLAALLPDRIQLFDTLDARPAGEPNFQLGSVRDLAISADGRVFASAGTLGSVRLWDLRLAQAWAEPRPGNATTTLIPWQPPAQPPPAPDWLPELAELIAGGRGTGTDYEPLAVTPLFALRARLLAGRETDFWTRWAKWFFADRATRAINPDSTMTVPQLAERVARANTLAAHELALQLAPDDAHAWARLAAFLRATPEMPDAPRRFTAEWCEQRARVLAPEDAEVRRLLVR